MKLILIYLTFFSLSSYTMQTVCVEKTLFNQIINTIEMDDFSSFKNLIKTKPEIVNYVIDNRTILFYSVSYNRLQFVNFLLKQENLKKELIDLQDVESGLKPLWLACRLNYNEIFKSLSTSLKTNLNNDINSTIDGLSIFDMPQDESDIKYQFLCKKLQED